MILNEGVAAPSRSMDALIDELNAVYAQVDDELRSYSKLANQNEDGAAQVHYQNALALQEKAHQITAKLSGGHY